MTTDALPLSGGRIMMLSSLRRDVMAQVICLSMLCFGGVAPCTALLTSFLSWSAVSLSSSLLVASTAAIMAVWDTFGCCSKV